MALIAYDEACGRLQQGDRLMLTYADPNKAGDRDKITFCESRGGVSLRTFLKLREQLQPQGDGLFPDMESQTFAWKG